MSSIVQSSAPVSGSGRALAALFLLPMALGALAGCDNMPGLGNDNDEHIQLGPVPVDGGPPLLPPQTGPRAPGRQDPHSPEAGAPPNTSSPVAGAVGCKMTDDGKQVCVVCTDASGKVVRDTCYAKDPPPAGGDCHQVRRPDGAVCTVCFDAAGNVAAAGCKGPANQPVPGTMPVPPGMPAPACSSTTEADGKTCTYCKDASGRVVEKGCTGPMTPPAPGAVTCKDYDRGAERCTVCTDAAGTVVKQGCWKIEPPPPQPELRCKEERTASGSVCVTCYDAKGAIVRHGCTTSQTPPVPPGPAAPPAPPVPPAPPAS